MTATQEFEQGYRDLQGFWFKMDAWPIWAAVAMLCGQHPDEFLEWDNRSKDAVTGDIMQMVGAAIRSKKLPVAGEVPSGATYNCEIDPATFIAWAAMKGYNTSFFNAYGALQNAPVRAHHYRDQCRIVARTLWMIEPTLTIKAVSEHTAMQEIGGGKNFGGWHTIRDWISDLDPRPADKKRGRRAAAKQ